MSSENFCINSTQLPIHFDVFTLFPAMFDGPLSESIVWRARERNLVSVALHDIRAYTVDRHHVCDDTPYGGGGGMIMKPEPIVRAVETVLTRPPGWRLPAASDDKARPDPPPWDLEMVPELPQKTAVVLLTPQGRVLTQNLVRELSTFSRLAMICGRYEGVDERVRTQLATHEVSIGDFVLSGGELAAMVLVDAITRVVPGALGDEMGAHHDSHSPGLDGLLEGPQYTRPPVFRGEAIPDVLISGHHANIAEWHRHQALLRTLQRRPELLPSLSLSDDDLEFLGKQGWQAEKKDKEQ